MGIEVITSTDAINIAMDRVSSFLDDDNQRVFQILGFHGIGKRKALQNLLEKRKIIPERHQWVVLDSPAPLKKSITKKPNSVHLWDDVFQSIIMDKEISSFFAALANRQVDFDGKFILVAADSEFPNFKFPDLPGVHIHMSAEDTIAQAIKCLRDRGAPEVLIENSIRNMLSYFENK
jgi:hypothetical protein